MDKIKVNGFTLTKAAFASEGIKGNTKFVLAALCEFADKEGKCFPSQATGLRRMTGLSRSTINSAIQQLKRLGYLTASRTPQGCKYTIRYAKMFAQHNASDVQNSDINIPKGVSKAPNASDVQISDINIPREDSKAPNASDVQISDIGDVQNSDIGDVQISDINIPENNIPDNNILDNLGGYTTLEAISKTNIGGYSLNCIDPGNSNQPSQPPPVADFKNKKETQKMQNKFVELSPLEKRVAARLNMLGMSDATERVIAAREAFAKESWSSTNADNELFKIAREIEPSASAPHFEPQPEPTPPPAATQQSMDFTAPDTTTTATPAASAVFSLESFDTFAAWLRRRDVWTQLKPLVEPHLTEKDVDARKAECRNIFAAVYAKIRNRRDIRNARGLLANILRDDIDELKRGTPKDEPRDLDSILAALATDFAAIYPKQASHMADILSVDRIPRSTLAYLSGLEAANWDGVRSPVQKVKSALTGYVYEAIGYAREEDIKDLRREITECMGHASEERAWVKRYREDGLDAEAAKCEDRAKRFEQRIQSAQNELIALESA